MDEPDDVDAASSAAAPSALASQRAQESENQASMIPPELQDTILQASLSTRRHRFHVSEELGRKLSVPPRRWRTDAARNRRLVRENDALVKAGRFDTVDGEQVFAAPPLTERIQVPPDSVSLDATKFDITEICVANIDTLSAALIVGDACTLNFANASTPGGGYRAGSSAQEEDLCRLLPQLIHSLEACRYPIKPNEVLLTRDLAAVRIPGTYDLCPNQGCVNILTAAMPCHGSAGRSGGPEWKDSVTLRMRAVLHAAQKSGLPNLVLGAWGCGAFGNPPGLVASLFREVLSSPEFRGAFACIVFAILDPRSSGNLAPFCKEILLMAQ